MRRMEKTPIRNNLTIRQFLREISHRVNLVYCLRGFPISFFKRWIFRRIERLIFNVADLLRRFPHYFFIPRVSLRQLTDRLPGVIDI